MYHGKIPPKYSLTFFFGEGDFCFLFFFLCEFLGVFLSKLFFIFKISLSQILAGIFVLFLFFSLSFWSN